MTISQTRDVLRVVHVISGDLWAGAEVQAFHLLCELRDRTQLKVILMNRGELHQRLIEAGIDVIIIDESKHSSPVIFFRLIRLLRQFRPDIVHTHRTKENILGALANRLSRGAVSLRTVHGAPEHLTGLKRKIVNEADRWTADILQHAAIAVSHDLKRDLEQYFRNTPVKLIENGIDTPDPERLTVNADIVQPAAINIGFFGRLTAVKRVDILINLAKLCQQRQTKHQYHFHIFGDGPMRPELEGMRDHLGVAAGLTFHGHQLEVQSFINQMDAVILCSDHEGTPMIALESLALGVPVIVHAVAGLADLANRYPDHVLPVYRNAPDDYLNLLEARTLTRTQPPQNLITRHSNASSVLNLYQTLQREKQR